MRLAFSTAYRWVFCASPNNGGGYACAGPHGTFGSMIADPPPDYATFTTAPRRTLAERWNGTGWTTQPTPNPTGSTGSGLSDVSCTSATTCTAVGSANGGTSTAVTLAERGDGTTWTIQTTPNPTQGSELSGVSCTSATACTAVGFGQNGTLAERWDGTTWTIPYTPNPTGAQFPSLSGGSCTSTTACIAVGSYFASTGTPLTLAERWDGVTWTIQATPTRPAPPHSQALRAHPPRRAPRSGATNGGAPSGRDSASASRSSFGLTVQASPTVAADAAAIAASWTPVPASVSCAS